MKYQIKNWDKFQQYKDDRPVHWIKLHVELLDDYNFDDLRELDQLHLLKLWLLAAKNRGTFEGSDKFISRKIGAAKLNLQNLIDAGFIVRTDESTCPYETVHREEKRREEENRVEKSVSPSLPVQVSEQSSFDDFYTKYPVKKNKEGARKAFNKLSLADQLTATNGIDGYVSTVSGKKYICHPATYLNNSRWTDGEGAKVDDDDYSWAEPRPKLSDSIDGVFEKC